MNSATKWTAISAVASVVALLVPLLPFFLKHDTKELTVETVSTAVLINLSDPLLSSLKLTHNDKAVSKLSVATIEIRNSGSRPIERADFDAPLMLRFKHPLDVLAVTLSDKNPTSLQPLIASEDGTISISPLLLNSGDHFRITVQIRDEFVEPAVETRISGVPAISRKMFATPDPTTKGMVRLVLATMLFSIYGYIGMFSMDTLFRRRPFTVMPFSENLAVVLALGTGGAVSAAWSANFLGLSMVQALMWAPVFFVPMLILGIFARRRSRRLLTAPKL